MAAATVYDPVTLVLSHSLIAAASVSFVPITDADGTRDDRDTPYCYGCCA
jgi:hypothetical protein